MSRDLDLSPELANRVRQELAAAPGAASSLPTAQAVEPAAAPRRRSFLERIGASLRPYWPLSSDVDRLTREMDEQYRRQDALSATLQALQADHETLMARQVSLEADLRFEHRRVARLCDTLPEGPGAGTPAAAGQGADRAALAAELRGLPVENDQARSERFARHFERIRNWPTLFPGRPLLDVGCGGGHWLRLVGQAGIEAYGIDIDEQAVSECKTLGADAQVADGVAHVSTLPDQCLGGVSLLRVVEYLPPDRLVRLLAEARRVLLPGGLLLMETPNADNLLVAARTFLDDPRRHRPVPSGLLCRLAKSHGFVIRDLESLNPYPDRFMIRDGSAAAGRLNELLYGATDVTVTAAKAQ
jgi:SAM-dependent methyltransferase